MTTAIVCSALLALLIFGLGINVSRLRKNATNQLPTRLDDPLFVAVRAHGNATEYVPTLALLMLLVGARDPAGWMVAVFVVVTVARYLHAAGVLAGGDMGKETPARLAGSLGTYLGGIALAAAALVVA